MVIISKEPQENSTVNPSTLSVGELITITNLPISKGDRWIYSAGFNIDTSLKDTKRIDIELPDIKYLSDCGAKIAILSHQGSWRDKTAIHLDFIANYLGKQLNRNVQYFPNNNSEDAVQYSHLMKNGDIVVFGNTRFHEGEEKGNKELAKQFACLGEFVAIGGFSKAHRQHSSTVGILDFLPGYSTTGLLQEFKTLEKLSKPYPNLNSIAIIGGVKLEKVTKGFKLFKEIYDFIIPGGSLLNNILKAENIHIGESYLGENPHEAFKATKAILANKGKAIILLPDEVVIAKKVNNGEYSNKQIVKIAHGIPENYMIVDFIMTNEMINIFSKCTALSTRVVVAGTPTLTNYGFSAFPDALLNLMSKNHISPFMMGGNTLEDLPFDCESSTGGGASLHYMAEKTCPVLEALIHNQIKWRNKVAF